MSGETSSALERRRPRSTPVCCARGRTVRRLGDPAGDIAHPLGQAARYNVVSGELTDGDEVVVSFDREVVGKPVRLAGRVVVNVLEPERFEPARGSWAHVSDVVVAVGDDRPPPVKPGAAVLVQLL
jgi:hypothetical protein